MIEAPQQNKKFDFNLACQMGITYEDLPPRTAREFKSIEHAVIALDRDPWFKGQFGNHGTTTEGVLDGVDSLDTLLTNVISNCQGRNKEVHIRAWGIRMVGMSQDHTFGDDSSNNHHQRVVDFVKSNCQTFGVEFPK